MIEAPDLPCERRRPAGGLLGRAVRPRVPPEIRPRRGASTCIATAARATTRPTRRPSPSRIIAPRKSPSRPTFGQIYKQQLIAEGVIPRRRRTRIEQAIWDKLEAGYQQDARAQEAGDRTAFSGSTGVVQPPYSHAPVPTGIDRDALQHIGTRAHRRARRLPPEPHAREALPPAPRRGARQRRPVRLGLRRGAGLRLAADRRTRRSACPARTAAAAPSASAMRCSTIPKPASATSRWNTSTPDQAQFCVYNSPAIRIRRARLRLRLLALATRHAHPVGGAVRRLRQRRAGHHRPVHRLRRIQVADAQRPRPAAAARLRRHGPGALQRPPRALPPALRRGQHACRQPHHARPVFPRPAPPEAPATSASR